MDCLAFAGNFFTEYIETEVVMRDVAILKDKKILVVGLGRTGVSLAQFLSNHGAAVTVTDHKSKAELSVQLEQLDANLIKADLGGHSPKTFLQQDLVILSPGVSPSLKIFDYTMQQCIKVTGEFEFITQFMGEPVIAITGTNGKTTVGRLIDAILKNSGVSSWFGGANETPMTEYLKSKERSKVVIAETSAFMLEMTETFAPSTIVFTNLAENHLDRYRTMEDYTRAKRSVFKHTNQMTTSILNADDNSVVETARDPAVQRGRIFYFSM